MDIYFLVYNKYLLYTIYTNKRFFVNFNQFFLFPYFPPHFFQNFFYIFLLIKLNDKKKTNFNALQQIILTKYQITNAIIPQDTGHFTRLRASRERYYEASAERSIPRQLGEPQVRKKLTIRFTPKRKTKIPEKKKPKSCLLLVV